MCTSSSNEEHGHRALQVQKLQGEYAAQVQKVEDLESRLRSTLNEMLVLKQEERELRDVISEQEISVDSMKKEIQIVREEKEDILMQSDVNLKTLQEAHNSAVTQLQSMHSSEIELLENRLAKEQVQERGQTYTMKQGCYVETISIKA